MNNIILTSTKNPLIKQVRKLHSAKERQKQNLLLLEGTNLIEAACQVDYKLDILFHTDHWQENNQLLWAQISQKAWKTQLVSPEVLMAIATTINPDGAVAIAPIRINTQPVIAQTRLGIAIERLQDPGNLGTMIRTAVAAGVDSFWLSADSVDINNPKVLRASAGEWFRISLGISDNFVDLVQLHKEAGIQIVATTAQATKSYWDIDFTRPSLILLGNEGAGLSTELITIADEQVTIPITNGVESLNVAIAGALILYEVKRQVVNN